MSKILSGRRTSLELKENAQFVQKVTSESLMDVKQNHYGNWKCYKRCYFKSFLRQSYKNTQLLFFTCDSAMRQTLTDDFGGLHENKNCAFPLNLDTN